MWNESYSHSRRNSFSGPIPDTYDRMRMRSPSPAVLTPQPNYGFQPSPIPSPRPVSTGGFVIPQHGYEPPIPPNVEWDERGRSTERGIDPYKGHLTVHTHQHRRYHSQEPRSVVPQAVPKEKERNKLRKRRHSQHRRPTSHGRTPNITIYAHGQTYTVPARPTTQYISGAPAQVVYAEPVTTSTQLRPSSSAQHLSHANVMASPRPNPVGQMQMPAVHFPPGDVVYYGPEIGHKRHYFQYSQCSGRKKALCIGINYIGQANQLRGCINDARRMRSFLIKRYRFDPGDIVLLTDEGKSQRERPTRRNIIDAMKWLVRDAKPNDSLFFHFSGHGGQTADLDGDEVDGYDETIFPLDWKKAGHIVDDDMHDIMVKPLPVGCRLTALFDCCHSGSALDLPYVYGTDGKLKREPNLLRAAGEDTFGDRPFIEGEVGLENLREAFADGMRGLGEQRKRRKYALRIKTHPADAISWAGCKDSQTSADTYSGSVAVGAMSHAFIGSLKAKPDQTYQELLISVREILKNKYSQIPQLSSSHPLDTSLKFVL